MKLLSVSVTERGRDLASRLPYERSHGNLAGTVRERWNDVDCFVLFIAVGAAVRIIAPLIAREESEPDRRPHANLPRIICVDDAGEFVVPLIGGHQRSEFFSNTHRGDKGANELAREVAAILQATPVITTATDATGTCALDSLPGLIAEGDVAGVSKAMLDGARPLLENELAWPVPDALRDASDVITTPERITGTPGEPSPPERAPHAASESDQERKPRLILTDEIVASAEGRAGKAVVLLRPPSIVAGVGTSTGATVEELEHLLDACLEESGLSRKSLGLIASAERRAKDPAIAGIGIETVFFSSETLSAVKVPTPSSTVRLAVGTPSVAEAAALEAAGPGGQLVLEKRKSAHATVALARWQPPRGSVSVVGIGPGERAHRTPAAEAAIRNAEVIIGYAPYLDACSDLVGAHQRLEAYAIGAEVERAQRALEVALTGKQVAVVCSGDPGVYGMASIVLEESARMPQLSEHEADQTTTEPLSGPPEIRVLPGVTASLTAASLLGAPLANDYLVISLSDHLTPWKLIESRLDAAAETDLTVAIYNPRSAARPWQLDAARDLLLQHRPPDTPVGVVTDAARHGQQALLTTLAGLDTTSVGMTSCVIVGSATTRVIRGLMVTPRGYPPNPRRH